MIDIDNPVSRLMIEYEDLLGRPRYNVPTIKDFKISLKKYFNIEKIDNKQGAMIKYFCVNK